MSNRREKLPAPDIGGTDPNEVLRRRLFDAPVGNASPAASAPIPAHTLSPDVVRAGKGGTRPDPQGMKRISLYVAQEAADALDTAADTVSRALGPDVPRHVALSALLEAGAQQAPAVAQLLIEQRAAELTARLHALQEQQHPHT